MIIKRYLSILCFLFLSSATHADQLYYGIALISQELTQKIQPISPSGPLATSKDSGSGLGLYADYFYKGDYRFNGTFSYIDYDTFNFISLTASADYLFPIDASFTLFTGITAGGAGMKFNDSGLSDMS